MAGKFEIWLSISFIFPSARCAFEILNFNRKSVAPAKLNSLPVRLHRFRPFRHFSRNFAQRVQSSTSARGHVHRSRPSFAQFYLRNSRLYVFVSTRWRRKIRILSALGKGEARSIKRTDRRVLMISRGNKDNTKPRWLVTLFGVAESSTHRHRGAQYFDSRRFATTLKEKVS